MTAYSVDTSAFLDAWVRHYPPDVMPAIWTHMDPLAAVGRLVFVEDVLLELDRKEDGAAAWVRHHPSAVVPLDVPIQPAARVVLREHEKLLDMRLNRSGADPFVIALAQVRNLKVLTGERATGSAKRPNIPDVCQALGVPCCGMVEMFRAEGIKI